MKQVAVIILLVLLTLQGKSQYSIADGANINACSGTLSPGNYIPGQIYTITICSDDPLHNRISLLFTSGIIYTTAAPQLCFYDGPDTNSNIIDCALWATAQSITCNQANSSGCITLTWKSDSLGSDFTANISCLPTCAVFTAETATVPASHIIDNELFVDICKNDTVHFSTSGIYNELGQMQNNVDYLFEWSVNYQTISSGYGTTNFEYSFNESMGYIVELTITDSLGCKQSNNGTFKIRVSASPLFNGTFSNLDHACTGQEIDLTGMATFDQSLYGNHNSISTDTAFIPDGSGVTYHNEILISGISSGVTLNDINDLTGICMNIEHSFLGDLVFFITCPNGTTVMLENQGGGGTYLGVPIDDDLPTPGVGWDYCWSPNPQYGLMNEVAPLYTTLPSGSYQSFQPLTNLLGCPLNGIWTLSITDNWSIDNGYLFGWHIDFDSIASNFSYQNNPVSYQWDGAEVTGGFSIQNQGNANSIIEFNSGEYPGEVISQPLTLYLTDDFGCIYDTTIQVNILDPLPINILGLDSAYYINGNQEQLTASFPGGYFSGPGIIQPDIFDPADAGLGLHQVLYTVNHVDTNFGSGNVEVFFDDFSSDLGWTGYDSLCWERDTASMSTGCSGAQDPAEDYSATDDNYIIGTRIGDCYLNSMPQTLWLSSPIIDCSGFNSCDIEFRSFSGFESFTFDHAYIDVFNGSTWQNIYTNTNTGAEASWTLKSFPVAQANHNSNFQVRFGLGTTDGSVNYNGWNIDDFSVKCNGSVTAIDTFCQKTYYKDVYVSQWPISVTSHEINTFKIFPNPVEDILYIQTDQPITIDIVLTDISGKVILIQKLTGSSNSISLEGIAPGTYFVEISGQHYCVVKK